MAAPFSHACRQAIQQTIRQSQSQCRASMRCMSTSSPTRATQQNRAIKEFPTEASIEAEYNTDDISSLAHTELNQHRELRQMARTAAWEMPLLSSLAQPYERPVLTEQPLRWRYTTYMGEAHPASRKVVVEFKPRHLGLTDAQEAKLIKLVGARYNPESKMIKMSCENFETQAQNKRHLGGIIQALLTEAKDPNADSFEDVPFDTRHHKPKQRLRFPEEWLLTEEKKAELEAKRSAKLLEEGQKVEQGQIVSGTEEISAARQRAQIAERQRLEEARQEETVVSRARPVRRAERVSPSLRRF